MKKDTKSLIFKHLHSIATCFDSYNFLSFKIVDKANSKFGLKIKEPLQINCGKPNLNAQQSHLSLTLLLQLPQPLFCFFLFVCFCFHVSFLPVILIIFDTNYWHLLLSELHFATTSLHYNTTCITPCSFIYYFQYLCTNYWRLLQS